MALSSPFYEVILIDIFQATTQQNCLFVSKIHKNIIEVVDY